MLNLITQIVLCLAAAMFLGFLLGWFGHKLFGSSGISEDEHNALRARLNESRDKSANLEVSLKECNETQTRMRSELAAANARASDWESSARKAESEARAQAKAASESIIAKAASADVVASAPIVKKTVVKRQSSVSVEKSQPKKVTKKAAAKKPATKAKKAVVKKAATKKASTKKATTKTTKKAAAKPAVKKTVVRKPAKKKAPSTKKATPKLAAKDDLKLISGVGPVIERRLNKLGITHFHHVAAFTKSDITRVGEAIEFFPDRISRDDWKSQASKLHKDKYGQKP